MSTGRAAPTDVRPFSNGTEGYDWVGWNCDRCAKRGEPNAQGEGPCPMETAVSRGFLLGTVPADLAVEYGATLSEQPGFCTMPRQCAQFVMTPTATCEYVPFPKRKRRVQCGVAMAGTVTHHQRQYAICERHAKGDETFVRAEVPASGVPA